MVAYVQEQPISRREGEERRREEEDSLAEDKGVTTALLLVADVQEQPISRREGEERRREEEDSPAEDKGDNHRIAIGCWCSGTANQPKRR